MPNHASVKVAKTVMEVADVAWTAIETQQRHNHHRNRETPLLMPSPPGKEDLEIESLRSENQRLRNLLQQNLTLFQSMSTEPSLLQNCPLDLHERLLAVVNSGSFLDQLENLRQKSVEGAACKFPFNEPSDEDLKKMEILINVGKEEPSWWVWVTEDMVPSNAEEGSGIDNENYVVVSEEQVVDGVANFMARCLVANPKAQKLTPEQLQQALTKALGGMNKVEKALNIWHAGMMFYTLGMWGLALTGLYKSRAALRLAAMGVHTSSKAVLKVL
ncbi:uncharacterized protein LOC111402041 isoform X1 [Olea europaea subsp. europaea]|uniref:Uncharacterized protein LOC111402041 isoform X1 n=1 Tax=Olea europaea subsp. europaea TaxID=158383 RepID=A0A8S0SG23_OLEEU|nr:uncharacterized protein LOC111402041 isoform X1 [Olea europaea subsp. europaea]